MHIPYVKVLIYSLTFLVYAYTGYGSGLLVNLRDAVIAAETVFGDVLKNVVTVAKKFKTLHEVFDAAVEENCVFKCPVDGVVPKPNKNHVPKANGCGTLGLNIDESLLHVSEMIKCCNQHDICYDTCNTNKEVCDVDFKQCLYRFCDSYEKNVGDKVVKACKGTAKILFTGTLALGCKAYLDAQEKACYCPSYGWKKEHKQSKYGRGDEL
ncbi:hypothetical protein FQA39_LY08963 [Lamprigera yunnana]|nr:hypothetical protein FQA39_LY08963 [Lamprigera yunnana]